MTAAKISKAPGRSAAAPRCRPTIEEVRDHGRPPVVRTTLRGSLQSPAARRSAEPSLASLARTPLRLEAALAALARPRCLRRSAISGSERIGDPRSTEELRSSGMTNDGSRSRRSNHDHRTPSCGLLARWRRAGCRYGNSLDGGHAATPAARGACGSLCLPVSPTRALGSFPSLPGGGRCRTPPLVRTSPASPASGFMYSPTQRPS